MTPRTAFASSLLFLAGVAVGASVNRPSAGQPPAAPATAPAAPGTFQVAVGGHTNVVAVTDTRTGRTWTNQGGLPHLPWHDLGVPGAKSGR